MSLVWHIVRKDFRRLRWPLFLWLVIPLVHWALLTSASGSVATGTNPVAFEGMMGFSGTWVGLTWVIGGILAAWLVMEDGLVGTRVFWRTRPVSAVRLFAAKMLGAILMFGVLPVLVMTSVWVMNGFSAGEWALAAIELFAKQAIFTVAAFTIASVTETAGQFLVRLIGATVLVPLTVGYCAGILGGWPGIDGTGSAETRYRLVMGVLILMPLVMIVHQYLTGRRVRSYALLGGGVALMLVLRFAWQWDLTSLYRKFPVDDALPGIKFTQEQPAAIEQLPEGPTKLLITGTMSGTPFGTLIGIDSVRGWWGEGRSRRNGAKLGREGDVPLEPATRQVAGLGGPAEVPVKWNVGGFESPESVARARANSEPLQIAFRANLMRGRVVGELPLRPGAILRSGSSMTRVTGVERVEGRLIVWLEERMAWSPWSVRVQDSYLLSNPAVAREADYLPIMGDRWLEFASISLHQRQLSIAIPMREVDGRIREVSGWEESARLVKVRFTPEQKFTKILTVPLPAHPAP